MNERRTKQIVIVVVLAVAALVFFNAFGQMLESAVVSAVPFWLVTPFVLLLLAIAIGPFVNKAWWDRNYPTVAAVLGAVVIGYYVYPLGNVSRILLSMHDYISFISLIGSLFVVAGGIHLNLRGKAAPWENVMLLGVGALLSSIVGTTGASMLLIRPYIKNNSYRIKGYHVVFFIFIVSNVGGTLTPIGDLPLFLGYLKGVPFLWVTAKAWFAWVIVLGMLLLVFYGIDRIHFRRVSRRVREEAMSPDEALFSGLHNVWFLLAIIAAVFVVRPLMLREVIMWGAAVGSYYTTRKEVRVRNEFNFVPLKEVAVLFVGIFATMIPALDWLQLNAGSLGIRTPGQFYWCTGILSSVLDNAPTYLGFMSAAFGLHGANLDNPVHVHAMLGQIQLGALGLPNPLLEGAVAITTESWRYVQAISLGAVFFGAMTYIGNGPNFMVKSIADLSGIESPSFLEYIWKYSVPILIPIFIVVWLLLF